MREYLKPHLRFWRGRWWCGMLFDTDIWWAQADCPVEAYRLWKLVHGWMLEGEK